MMTVHISDVARSLVALDDELNAVIDVMAHMIDVMAHMNRAHLKLMMEIHNEHRAQMVALEKKAKTLSDAIHKIEQSLIGGGV